MKHSQLPWQEGEEFYFIHDNLGNIIVEQLNDLDRKFIIEACNNYERVLEENKKLKEQNKYLNNGIIGYENFMEVICDESEENKKLKEALIDSNAEIYQANCVCHGDIECSRCMQIRENKKLIEGCENNET